MTKEFKDANDRASMILTLHKKTSKSIGEILRERQEQLGYIDYLTDINNPIIDFEEWKQRKDKL